MQALKINEPRANEPFAQAKETRRTTLAGPPRDSAASSRACVRAQVLFVIALLLALPSAALAQHPIPEAERWATITHPGNAPYSSSFQDLGSYGLPMGSVNYEYQISRTEVTAEEWYEFVIAYAPFVSESRRASFEFTGPWVSVSEPTPGQIDYHLSDAFRNKPTENSWRFAARYVNWLHNERSLTPEAFESGVYETSTFGDIPGGGFTDQRTRSPGATYFLPTIDEWIKASFFDPHRYAMDQSGYWEYPHASDVPPVPGVPGVGQTSAGVSMPFFHPDVAAYSAVQSPWGLWDLSGGASEWLETPLVEPSTDIARWRLLRGTRAGAFDTFDDWIPITDDSIPRSLNGFRIARIIPTPGVAIVVVPGISLLVRRRRSCSCGSCQSF